MKSVFIGKSYSQLSKRQGINSAFWLNGYEFFGRNHVNNFMFVKCFNNGNIIEADSLCDN